MDSDYIDIYCERVDGSFWAEPINAITNLAFIIAAIALIVIGKRKGILGVRAIILSAFVFIIGVGSFLFHTFATFEAKLADVIPILIYQILFLVFYADDAMRLSKLKTLSLLGLFFASIFAVGFLPYEWLNGSLGYAPALLFVAGFGVWHLKNSENHKSILLWAAGIFTLSLTFRSLDYAVCGILPIGVHYFWHIFNGLVLFLTTYAYMVSKKDN